jgi:nicotinate (nicotinamide) nucleotide adenylyltransferase
VQPVAEADDRFVMAHLATLEDPQLIVTGVEIERGRDNPEPSFTVYTIERYRARYQGLPIVLIVGADNVAFHKWHRSSEYPALLSRIAVVSRPGYESDLDSALDEVTTHKPEIGEIIDTLPIVENPISSTALRENLAQNYFPEGALHPWVERYIRKYGLYGVRRGLD